MATQVRYCCPGKPWTEEPGGLQSVGSARVGHDCVTGTFFAVSVASFFLIPAFVLSAAPLTFL